MAWNNASLGPPYLGNVLNTENIAIYITGKHGCMINRGICKDSSVVDNSLVSGKFKKKLYYTKFLNFINNNHL